MRGIVLGVLIAMAAAPAAHAATLHGHQQIVFQTDFGRMMDLLDYTGAAGEANQVTYALSADAKEVTVTDPGARIAATGTCSAVDEHTARCRTSTGLVKPTVVLGDGDDRLEVVAPDVAPYAVTARGDAGADTLITGPAPDSADGGAGADVLDTGAGFDLLLGGGGADALRGGEGDDRLNDQDASGGADADTLDGGAGRDVADYGRRTAPLVIALWDLGPDGEAGEGDTLTGIEDVAAGSGDDSLAGSDADNLLLGGDGDDALSGGNGDDELVGDAGRDTALCGEGTDVVENPDRHVNVVRRCDTVRLVRPQPRVEYTLRAHPLAVGRRAVRLRFACPVHVATDPLHGGPVFGRQACSGRLRLHEAVGKRRRLGSVQVDHDPQAFTLAVPLNRLGRERVADGVDVVVSTRGEKLPPVAWRIRLKR